MQVIPAIDLRGGRCVRLLQGKKEQETVYSDDPVAVARRWEEEGAGRLHVVDLDGAFDGRPRNREVILEIARTVKIPVQVGGGMREYAVIEDYLQRGVSRVILGTVAVTDTTLLKKLVAQFGERIIVGIDARDGWASIKGWVEESSTRAVDLARQVEQCGVAEIIYTDIKRDGTLKGPNFDLLAELASSTSLSIIASGGVSSREDVQRLQELEPLGVKGVIIGQALYSGKIQLRDVLTI